MKLEKWHEQFRKREEEGLYDNIVPVPVTERQQIDEAAFKKQISARLKETTERAKGFGR